MSNVAPIQRPKIDLSKITKGRITDKALRVCIYGDAKVGKTTFANGAPDPFIIDLESGSLEMDAQRVQPASWEEALMWMDAVIGGDVKCKTVVIDSLSRLEEHLEKKLFPNQGVNEYSGGYGKGEDAMAVQWREYLLKADRIWRMGIHVVHVAHAALTQFSNPEGPDYDRWTIGLRKKMAGPIKKYTDYIVFAKRETTSIKTEDKRKGTWAGQRVLHPTWAPAYDAGGRVDLPEVLPLSWADFYAAVIATETRVADLKKQIESALVAIGDDAYSATVRKFVDEHGGDMNKLAEVCSRVSKKLSEKQETKS